MFVVRPFTDRNLYFPSISAYLIDLTTNYVYNTVKPEQGLWSYDGALLKNVNGNYLGYVDGVITNAPTKWLFDGYTFYVADSFVVNSNNVLAITGNNKGIIEVTPVSISNVGKPGNGAVVVV